MAMSFTDQKPFTVTAEDLTLPWSCGKNGKYFRCHLCGYKFKDGDIARWQFTNNIPGAGGNPMVCQGCDGPPQEVIAKWAKLCAEFKELREGRMWWFLKKREE